MSARLISVTAPDMAKFASGESRRLSVLYVVARLEKGGSSTLVTERCRQLAQVGVDVHVCSLFAFEHTTKAPDEAALDAVSGRVHTLNHRSRYGWARTLAKLVALCRSVDVVHHVNAPVSYTMIAVALARRPLVSDVISTLAPRVGQRALYRLSAVNVSVSHAALATKAVPRAQVIYPPLPTVVEGISDRRQRRSPFTVLVISRLAPNKGMDQFPEVVARVHLDLPEARFLVAGSGPGRAQLLDALHDRKLQDVVELLGYRTDLAQLHALSDAYLSMSSAEGLVGYSTLEAALYGTPIVATRIEAVTEILRDRVDALLVDPKSPDEAAKALLELATDQQTRDRIAASARRRVLSKLDSAESTKMLQNVYESVAAAGVLQRLAIPVRSKRRF